MTQPTPPPAKTNPIVRYFKRMGAGSMAISIIVHVFLLGGATVYVVSSAQPPRKASFRGGGGDGSAATIQRPVKMAPNQPNLSTLNKRLSVASSNAAVALPDLPDTPNPSMATGASAPAAGGPAGPGMGLGNLKGPLMPLFGFKEAKGTNGLLEGKFYDLKQTPKLAVHPELSKLSGRDQMTLLLKKAIDDLVQNEFKPSVLSSYYKAPCELYVGQIFIPPIGAGSAPKSFGVEEKVKPTAWLAHYRGKVSPPVSGTFRFVGSGDDVLVVRLGGKLVLDANHGALVTDLFKPDRSAFPAYPYVGMQAGFKRARGGFVVGNAMDLIAGKFYDLDVVIGERGGQFAAMLLVEQTGVDYKKDQAGNPILPVFRVANSQLDKIEAGIPFMTDGPIWRCLPPAK